MGIKELGSFLNKNCPQAIYNIKLSDKGGQIAAIDTSLYFYKFKYSHGQYFLEKFIEMINRLKINKIRPIFIFDGAPPCEKLKTISERKDKKTEYKELVIYLKNKMSECGTLEEKYTIQENINKINKRIIYVTKDDIQKLKILLNHLNISFIHKNVEADLISSKLCSSGIVDMVFSEDMDHLTSGTKYLIRDFNVKNNIATCYDLHKIKEGLDIDHMQFINLCILFGCDYIKRIKGLGTVSSFKLIKQFNTIEDMLDNIKKKLVVKSDYIDNYKKAQTIFLNEDININNEDIIQFPIFEKQRENAITYLKQNTTLSEKKILNRINNILI